MHANYSRAARLSLRHQSPFTGFNDPQTQTPRQIHGERQTDRHGPVHTQRKIGVGFPTFRGLPHFRP